MEYLKASFRGNNPRHIYRTQLDLQGLTPEQIIKIEPETIPEHILEEPYRKGANLTRQQKSAVLKLISLFTTGLRISRLKKSLKKRQIKMYFNSLTYSLTVSYP